MRFIRKKIFKKIILENFPEEARQERRLNWSYFPIQEEKIIHLFKKLMKGEKNAKDVNETRNRKQLCHPERVEGPCVPSHYREFITINLGSVISSIA